MITPCPHCQTDLELDAETLTALGDAAAFACPVCQGEVPNPALKPEEEIVIAPCVHCGGEFEVDQPTLAALRNKVVFPCPLCTRMLPVSMFRITDDDVPAAPATQRKTLATPGWRPPVPGTLSKAQPKAKKPSHPRFQALRVLNRNILILGAAALLALGGIGFFLASRPTGDVVLTREDRVREMVKNQYFQDLIASGKADKKTLLKSWEIRPYGVGYVGISGETGTWQEAETLAKKVGATVFRLDPSEKVDTNSWWWKDRVSRGLVSASDSGDAAARSAFLSWLPDVVADLDGETLWFFDHSEPKVIAGSTVGRVSTMDHKRRVILYWQNSNITL